MTDTQNRIVGMLYWLIGACALCALLAAVNGCAVVRQRAVTETHGTNGLVEIKRSGSTVVAIGDAKNTVDKIRATAGKTASIGLSGVENEATTTNLAADLNALANVLKALRPVPVP